MMDGEEILEQEGPDAACANCGHSGQDHLVQEIEVSGDTIRRTYCQSCDASCEYVPIPEGDDPV